MTCPVCTIDETDWCRAHPAACVTCADDHAVRDGQCHHCSLMSRIAAATCGCGRLVASPIATTLGKGWACACGPLFSTRIERTAA